MPGGAGDAPRVTIITATYNSQDTLRLALESARRQTLADFEALVVGDGCTDESEAVVTALGDQRFRWIGLPGNSGSSAAPNNAGLREARGRHVAYLGHDDLWFPWHLDRVVGALERGETELAHTIAAYVGRGGFAHTVAGPAQGRSYAEGHIPPSSFAHRRALAERIGFWRHPDDLAINVDIDFTRRAALSGARFVLVPELTVIKFPSPWWTSYRQGAERPQVRYAAAMALDPRALQLELLHGAAAELSRLRHPHPSLARAWRGIGALAADRLFHILNHPRSPLRPLTRWIHRRRRARLRTARGLD